MLAMTIDPLVILGVGIAIVLFLIIAIRANAFLALITAAMVVSLLSPGEPNEKISRVAVAFGQACGNLAIVIGLAAIIGECMMHSGAADKIVQSSLAVFGERRASFALMLSAYIIAIPVFFDTVFYLMIPLARSLCRRTGKNFLLYVLAIAAGGAATHTLVPPTPGPLAVAGTIGVSLGIMILAGVAVSAPTAILGELVFSRTMNRFLPVPMRSVPGALEHEPVAEDKLPSFLASVTPILLPVLLISLDTTVDGLQRTAQAAPPVVSVAEMPEEGTAEESEYVQTLASIRRVTAIIGEKNLALLLAAVVAMAVLQRQRGLTLLKLDSYVERSLMSAGVIILITASGGAFGKMLEVAGVGDAVKGYFAGEGATTGMTYLLLAYSLAAIIKVAQGSSTVAMITTAGLFKGIMGEGDPASLLGFHPVYLATGIAAGSLMGSWMNDSGFWVFAKMSGLTERETLRSWTPLLAFLSLVAFAVTCLLVVVAPLV